MKSERISSAAAEPVNRPDDFSGDVRMQAICRPADATGVEMLVVHFPAGGRTVPHVHSVDQMLHVIEGDGVVATETERHLVGAGDVMVVPAGTWHWHGGMPTSAMSHIPIKPFGETDWKPPEKNWASYMAV